MQLAILQESAADDADYSQFHHSLAEILNSRGSKVTVFQSASNRWQNLEHLGPICRAFSLQKHWSQITSNSLVYGSPLTMLPFLDAPVTPIIAFHQVSESFQRSISYPDYGEETAILKKHLEESRSAGLVLDDDKDQNGGLVKETEEAVCQTNYPLVASTRRVKEDLMRYYDVKPNRITIVPYGIETSWFQNPAPCAECDEKFREFNPDEPILVFYAHIRRGLTDFLAQGIDRLLETFQRIRDLQKMVILYTDDPAYRSLFARYGTLVVENPSQEHLPHLFHHGGMYIQTARYESRSLPLIQAMASNLPIISFPVGLAEDVIETRKNGFLVQNLIQLVAKVDFLRNNPSKAKEFGRNASRLARSKFSLEKSAEQYEKYLNELAS